MERYRPIIDDWDAFVAASEQEPVPAVRRNPLKAGDDFEQRLRDRFPSAEQADWHPDVYRLPGVETPGKSSLHWRGAYYVQEASAAVPVTVLDPQPGEHILDMAAAPGGKTTQIAAHLGNEGMVVANDPNPNRLQSLHANIYRTGAACATVTQYEGQHLPEDEQYDRVLVDAPCTGEGNQVRRDFTAASDDDTHGLASLQIQLLRKAAALVKDGGTVVYSTCTFAPAENEGVVSKALGETDLALDRIEVDVPHQRGVTGFEDETYPDAVRDTIRIYPHHMDAGGMYVARFVN